MYIEFEMHEFDEFIFPLLQNEGFTKEDRNYMIIYSNVDSGLGQISLDKDEGKTELRFTEPLYPKVIDVFPSEEALLIEARNMISGRDYPHEVKKRLDEEFVRRKEKKQIIVEKVVSQYLKCIDYDKGKTKTESKSSLNDFSDEKLLKKEIPYDDYRMIISAYMAGASDREIADLVHSSPASIKNIVSILKRVFPDYLPHRKDMKSKKHSK